MPNVVDPLATANKKFSGSAAPSELAAAVRTIAVKSIKIATKIPICRRKLTNRLNRKFIDFSSMIELVNPVSVTQ